MIVRGGMGTVTANLAAAARKAGVRIETGVGVEGVDRTGSAVSGARLSDGREVSARAVVAGCDPFRMRDLVGAEALPEDYNRRLDGYRRDGTTLKLNLALDGLPQFSCLPEDRGQHRCTIHLLPETDVIASLDRAFADASAGRLPERPAIEWYTHTTADPSLGDGSGRHSAALFVQWVPYAIEGSSWDKELSGYVDRLLAICDEFAPDTSSRVVDAFPLPPPAIERHFGMTRGHIHHVDNSFGFADRLPYATPVDGLYACGAGCHPAGSVIGAAGHNAARRVLRDLGRGEPTG